MKNKIIPVVTLINEEDTKQKLSALLEGGIDIAEITFRTDYAKKGLEYAINHFPNMTIGAGTIINVKQAEEAYKLGAKFLVSPGLSIDVAKFCQEKNLDYYPGCATPTEIMKAIDLGCTIIKFFPANIYGGLKALKALSAPFPQIKFIPTGGIDLTNLEKYLSYEKVYAVGGSFMMKGNIVDNCKKIKEIINATFNK